MLVLLKSDWYTGNYHFRRKGTPQEIPDSLKELLPPSAKIVSEDVHTADTFVPVTRPVAGGFPFMEAMRQIDAKDRGEVVPEISGKALLEANDLERAASDGENALREKAAAFNRQLAAEAKAENKRTAKGK